VVVLLGDAYAAKRLADRLAYTVKQAPEDYAFHTSMVDRSWHYVGGKVGGTLRYPTITDEASMAKEAAEHAERLGGLTVEQYTERALAEVRADHAADVAKGEYSKFFNVGWCSRLDLARKLADGGHRFTNPEKVVILEAVRGKPDKAVR
jgi:hypothetical protein